MSYLDFAKQPEAMLELPDSQSAETLEAFRRVQLSNGEVVKLDEGFHVTRRDGRFVWIAGPTTITWREA